MHELEKSSAAVVIRQGGRKFNPEDFVGKLVSVSTELIIPMEGQPREHFGEVDLARLRKSIEQEGQQQPGTIVPWGTGFRLRDGERRFRCCQDLVKRFLAVVCTAESVEREFELAGIANFLGVVHSPLEKSRYIQRLTEGPLQRTLTQVALSVGVTRTTVDNYLLLVKKLSPGAQAFLDARMHNPPLKASLGLLLPAFAAFPDHQTRMAAHMLEQKMSLQIATRYVEREAERLGIKSGRGRERKPSDKLANLRTTLRRLGENMTGFTPMPQSDIDSLFAHIPEKEHAAVVHETEKRIEELTAFRDRLRAVRGAGSRRGQLHAVAS